MFSSGQYANKVHVKPVFHMLHVPSATAAAEAMERWMLRRELARPLEVGGSWGIDSVASELRGGGAHWACWCVWMEQASLPGVLPLLDLYLRDASQKGGVAAESRAEKEGR